MVYVDYKEMLTTARQKFIDGDYATAEKLLQQVLLLNNKQPEVFHILGTIYYDRSQFSKSIKHFKRALEIDPTYTDASIGLSIILNDLGRYEEGKEIFEEAQSLLNKKGKTKPDPYVDEKLAEKHLQLGDMYLQFQRSDEALEQYYKSYRLAQKSDVRMKIVETYLKKGDNDRAAQELHSLVKDEPQFLQAYIKLGLVYYNAGKTVEALNQWEKVLFRDPDNQEAKRYLRLAQQSRESTL
ncbi:MAG: tetratricopeptide repeat protein [Bdellovibrionales bacterium]